jgi:hypothetical protein
MGQARAPEPMVNEMNRWASTVEMPTRFFSDRAHCTFNERDN